MALSSFEYFSEHCAQIVDKQRNVVPFILNGAQKKLAETLLPLIKKETRLEKRLTVIIPKARQQGISTFSVEFLNYIASFLQDLENTSICYTLPVTDTVSKFYTKKVEPMISAIHPDIFPTITKESLGSSILLKYPEIKGIRRNNYLEIVSANANSIRSDSVHILVEDEVCSYSKPEILQDAVMPTLPDTGFSLVIYLSTFDDRKNDFFYKQMQIALENPEDYRLVFLPWYLLYPEIKMGIPLDSLKLTEYDETVILPALQKDGIPKEEWGDCIDWYHRRRLTVSNMVKEFPTTLEELLTMNQDKGVFSKESIEKQRKNIYPGTPYRMVTDTITGKVEAIPTDSSPVMVYKQPHPGHKYLLCCDPITASNEDTDFFTMTMMDLTNNEQVATFRGKEYATEDYAEFAICLSKLYGRALICPEKNVAEGFVACIRGKGYYNFYYVNETSRKNRDPGIRTTVSSKENMIDRLRLLLDTDNIILHDKNWVDELEWFEKKTKTRADGSVSVKMAARKSKTDDCISSLWVFAGTLSQAQLTGQKRSSFSVL